MFCVLIRPTPFAWVVALFLPPGGIAQKSVAQSTDRGPGQGQVEGPEPPARVREEASRELGRGYADF